MTDQTSQPQSGKRNLGRGLAALFGLGWGLAGCCPGPAIANLASGSMAVFGFVVAMVAGMAVGNQMRSH